MRTHIEQPAAPSQPLSGYLTRGPRLPCASQQDCHEPSHGDGLPLCRFRVIGAAGRGPVALLLSRDCGRCVRLSCRRLVPSRPARLRLNPPAGIRARVKGPPSRASQEDIAQVDPRRRRRSVDALMRSSVRRPPDTSLSLRESARRGGPSSPLRPAAHVHKDPLRPPIPFSIARRTDSTLTGTTDRRRSDSRVRTSGPRRADRQAERG